MWQHIQFLPITNWFAGGREQEIEDISYLKDQLQSLVAWLKGEWRAIGLAIDRCKDPSLLFQLQCQQQTVNFLGTKWCQKLSTIKIGQKLDWPLHIRLAAAAGDHEDGGEIEGKVNQEDEEFQLLGGGGLEFEAENTEVMTLL
ncbi:hypothetical protein BS47DRAFT_1365747 [Hydnum rufescens UP504]|uniref:Uncharacterized protein n=1 Tax=Hydnum rufescens UP504 TaxID=1448309 RepID=A0A9P6APV7_9AGAM|nr:hypothetical protein BS47DRAFT_1365747 [Hydnum rufescens UP504]